MYEFKIGFADVWGSNTTTANERAGFAIVARNVVGPVTYTWGADNVNEDNPSTWGHLEIPEFRDLLLPVATLLLLGLLRRRRRQIT